MSSVAMGYLTFKRVLKNKNQSERMECKVADSRAWSMSIDKVRRTQCELSTHLMSEETNSMEEKGVGAQGMFSSQTNLRLVK